MACIALYDAGHIAGRFVVYVTASRASEFDVTLSRFEAAIRDTAYITA